MDIPSLDECPDAKDHDWEEVNPIESKPNTKTTATPTSLYRCSNCGMEVTDVDPREID